MKYLITGAAGFIGGHLYEKLKNDGHEVIGVDNFFHSSSNPINKEIKYCDVRYYQDIEPYVKWADVVFHLAAQIHVDRSIVSPQETVDINITGTMNVLEAVKKYDKKMVFASSSEVYGTQKYTGIECYCKIRSGIADGLGDIPELHPLDAQSPYAATKVAGDRLCKSYYDTYRTKVAILRNFNTFGPYQADDSYGGVIGIFTRKALSGERLEINGDGKQQRDYMYIDDAIRGYELCIKKELWGTPINIGTGQVISINNLAEIIKSLTESESEIVHVKPRPGEVMRLCADITFAKSLGFKPTTKLNDNLKMYVQWYKDTHRR